MSSGYRNVNVSVLVAFFLCSSAVLAAYANGVSVCWLREHFGRDCVLCGCTRDIVDILSGEAPTRNSLSGYLLIGFALEVTWRVVASFISFGHRVICVDAVFHGVMALVFVMFNINNLKLLAG